MYEADMNLCRLRTFKLLRILPSKFVLFYRVPDPDEEPELSPDPVVVVVGI